MRGLNDWRRNRNLNPQQTVMATASLVPWPQLAAQKSAKGLFPYYKPAMVENECLWRNLDPLLSINLGYHKTGFEAHGISWPNSQTFPSAFIAQNTSKKGGCEILANKAVESSCTKHYSLMAGQEDQSYICSYCRTGNFHGHEIFATFVVGLTQQKFW